MSFQACVCTAGGGGGVATLTLVCTFLVRNQLYGVRLEVSGIATGDDGLACLKSTSTAKSRVSRCQTLAKHTPLSLPHSPD